MKCVVCKKPIHPERRAAVPQAKTCGKVCGEELRKRTAAAAKRRHRAAARQGKQS